jgi:uncharacterized protein (UPF0147 family)
MSSESTFMDDPMVGIIEALSELQNDTSVPRNVKSKIMGIIGVLQDDSEVSIRINKALNELDEISEDSNMQPYTRTQIWNVVSLLETI